MEAHHTRHAGRPLFRYLFLLNSLVCIVLASDGPSISPHARNPEPLSRCEYVLRDIPRYAFESAAPVPPHHTVVAQIKTDFAALRQHMHAYNGLVNTRLKLSGRALNHLHRTVALLRRCTIRHIFPDHRYFSAS
jgi:hypothetical protein